MALAALCDEMITEGAFEDVIRSVDAELCANEPRAAAERVAALALDQVTWAEQQGMTLEAIPLDPGFVRRLVAWMPALALDEGGAAAHRESLQQLIDVAVDHLSAARRTLYLGY